MDQNGTITAGVKPGKCSVYAMAHNGAKTAVAVTVKNYAKEDDFYNYGKEDDEIYIELDDHANLVVTPSNTDISNLKEDIEKLLIDFPYDISIEITADSVEYISKEIYNNGETLTSHVTFFFDNDCNQWENIQIGPHWTAYRFYPHQELEK